PRLPVSTLFPYTTLFRSLSVISFLHRAARPESSPLGTEMGPELDQRLVMHRADRLRVDPELRGDLRHVHVAVVKHAENLLLARRSEEHTSELQSRENLVC